MIKYRTVSVDIDTKAKSSWSSKRYTPDLPEVRIQVQSKLEEYDEMGYDLFSITPLQACVMNNSYTHSILLVFKLRED